MPIQKIDDNLRTRAIGKIRMGIVKPGTNYPTDVPYFVLKDAPEIERVYGKDPTSIEVFFAGDTIDDATPYWYKWFSGGSKDAQGKQLGGKLNCQGDGNNANFFLQRDPLTRVVPTRQCLAEACPDWNSKNGNAQCRPTMTLKVWVPRVSLLGYYEIDTKSIMAINNVLGVLKPLFDKTNHLKGIPFQLTRKAVKLDTFGPDGKKITATHWPLFVAPLEPVIFAEKYGRELSDRTRSYTMSAIIEHKQPEQLEAPEADPAPVLEAAAGPALGIESVAEDPELSDLFKTLCSLKTKQNTAKLRLLTARQFEKDEDPKASLKVYLDEQIAALQKKEAAANPTAGLTSQPPATTAQAQPPVNADGLI